jgi:hypothetical protein
VLVSVHREDSVDKAKRDGPAIIGERKCDLVLKGGVTSGLVYPTFLARLAESYRFESVGGTSSGAIAAAGAAVAQLARDHGIHDAFAKVAGLPAYLAHREGRGPSKLLALFQPESKALPTFKVVISLVDRTRGGPLPLRLLASVIANFPLAAILAVLPGLLVICSSLLEVRDAGLSYAQGGLLVVETLLTVTSAAVWLLIWFVYRSAKAISSNHFGLCTGMPGGTAGGVALTQWMHQYYNDLLGQVETDPITFGQLWRNPERPDKRKIDLQVVTTALNLECPIRIPGDNGEDPMQVFFYDPKEWQQFFPADVLAWLKARTRHSELAGRLVDAEGHTLGLLPLPAMEHLPIVVAVRMSVSFPLLLSAVPLYTVDWTLRLNREAGETGVLRPSKIYFSDGAITSNFPIHLFDAPLPAHPTFGVNLERTHPDNRHDPSVWRPSSNREGIVRRATQFPTLPGLKALWQFVWSILTTARTWRDTMQQTMPGYRDRIVHINLDDRQGGLNLHMNNTVIGQLGRLGTLAADELIGAFVHAAPSDKFNAWDNHRWVRMRSTVCSMERYLLELKKDLVHGIPSYAELPGCEHPPSYAFSSPDDGPRARDLLNGLASLARQHDEGKGPCEGAPRPVHALRISPSW